MLEFFNNLWGLGTSSNRVVLTVRQATFAGGIHSLESIPGLHKRLKIRALATLDGGIDSLESIPGLFKSLKYRLWSFQAIRSIQIYVFSIKAQDPEGSAFILPSRYNRNTMNKQNIEI